MGKFNVGDKVVARCSHVDITGGEAYHVAGIDTDGVAYVYDDVNHLSPVMECYFEHAAPPFDPYANEKASDDLTPDEKTEFMRLHFNETPLEFRMEGQATWHAASSPQIMGSTVYRAIKPAEPMRVDFSLFNDEFICAAADESGSIYVYVDEPSKVGLTWLPNSDKHNKATHLKSTSRGTVPWDKSIIWRDGYGPKVGE